MIRKMIVLASFMFVSSTLSAQTAVEGSWNFQMSSQMGSVSAVVTMEIDGSSLTGKFDLGGGRTWEIEDGTVEGDTISFNINRDGAAFTYVMNASVEGDSIKGTASAMGSTVPWSMTRSS